MPKIWTFNFTIYAIGMFFSVVGNTVSTLALALLIFRHTGQTSDIAIVFALNAIASIFAPFAGKLIDKTSVKYVLSYLDFARGFAIFGFLAWVNYNGLDQLVVYLFAALNALLGTIYRPTIGAFLPKLVGLANIVRANSVMGFVYSASGIVGYFFGGILVSLVGADWALFFDALSFIAMGGALLLIRDRQLIDASPLKTGDDGSSNEAMKTPIQIVELMVRTGIVCVPMVSVVAMIALAPYQVEWPRLFESVDGGLFFAFESLGAAISSIVVYKLAIRALNKGALALSLLTIPLLVFAPVISKDLYFLFIVGLCLGFVTSFAFFTLYSSIQVQMPAKARGQIFGVMEPLERLPMFFVFLTIGQLNQMFGFEVVFGLASIVSVFGIGAIMLIVHKRSLFETAHETIAKVPET